jgi:hypothetical protein
MKHSHHHDNLRSAGLQLKQERSESNHPSSRADSNGGASDDPPSEVQTPRPMGNGKGRGALSDQEQPELRQASEPNNAFLNPIQSFWPTPSA